MPNSDRNRKNARLIEDPFRARRTVGVLVVGGSRLRTAPAERIAGTLSAFHSTSQGVSPRQRSQQPISSATKIACNPGMKPACAPQRAVRRLARAAFHYRRVTPQGASDSRLVLHTVACGAQISKYAVGALAAMPAKATGRGR
jgi:hypothetical protein